MPAVAKERYYEPAPDTIDVEEFRKVVDSRRSVRKFTDKPIPPDVLNDCIDMAMLPPKDHLTSFAFAGSHSRKPRISSLV